MRATIRSGPAADCQGKEPYESYAHAEKVKRRRGGALLRIYRCAHCNSYHLGHKNRDIR